MAKALPLVGAGVGFLIGGPAGASIGASIGGGITSLLGPTAGDIANSAVASFAANHGPATVAPAAAVPKPTPLPTPDSDAVAAAQTRSIADQVARRGRASTILTDTNSSNSTLGGA